MLSPLVQANATSMSASSLPALSRGHVEPANVTGRQRARVDINGDWERHVNGALYDIFRAPSSRRPLGYYQLKRSFLLPKLSPSQRAILRFDAITYHARVFVNGAELGTMGPYVPYEFDFTAQAREGSNQVEVAISDLTPDPDGAGKDEIKLGLNPGWEGYGGIIRDVYVEVRPAAFIDNLRLSYKLNSDYTAVDCAVELHLSSSIETSGEAEVALYQGKVAVAKANKAVTIPKGHSEVVLSFELKAPLLWSPEEPNLYRLAANLRTDNGPDQFDCRTGFRNFTIRGTTFELNGRPIVLNGVCRHDMWKDQGFTLSREQMEQDMRMIKGLGCNFVRLVHYPHHRYIVELADELGLLVSEEPGYWGMDFKTMQRSMIELGLRIMERTIRRDWNSPSVFAWLLSNECTLTVESLKEGKALCNRLDPIARLVSVAVFMKNNEEARAIFEQAGMDFFDQHPYGFDENKFRKAVDAFGGSRPTIFTEWGWEIVGGEGIVYDRDFDRLLDLVETQKVAGHAFWSWQDMREYSRIDWPTQNGILLSGVVTEAREPRPRLYLELARLFQRRRREELPAFGRPQIVPLRWTPWSSKSQFQPIDLQAPADSETGKRAWSDLESVLAEFWSKSRMARNQWKRTGEKLRLWQGSKVEITGVGFSIPLVDDFVRPLVLTPRFREVEIPVRTVATQLHFLGQVTVPSGFPTTGQAGQTVATYRIRYAGGKVKEVLLRDGIEVALANLIYGSTRINPLVTSAQRVLEFVKDVARENYQVLLFSVPTGGGRIESVTCQLVGQHPLLLFAITAERDSKST
jgi:Glycosyl hydrolases family 2, TIM barrel domain/Glycosyl hydrolases family 2/Glycosyl hydrolases family 2, sugar binding domain